MTGQDEVVGGMGSGAEGPGSHVVVPMPPFDGREPEPVEVRVAVASAGSAQRIAGDLVARELVTSVHVLGPMASIYFWEGTVHQTEEWLLLAHTTTTHLPRVTALVRELHTYEVPEVLAVHVIREGGE